MSNIFTDAETRIEYFKRQFAPVFKNVNSCDISEGVLRIRWGKGARMGVLEVEKVNREGFTANISVPLEHGVKVSEKSIDQMAAFVALTEEIWRNK